jgi:hypothetical protein
MGNELERVRAQRDRAWRTLARIEAALGTADESQLAFLLADSYGPDDIDEYEAATRECDP